MLLKMMLQGHAPITPNPLLYVRPSLCRLVECCVFNPVNLKTVTQAEQKASSLAGWLLCCGFCVPANVLALRRWLLETLPILSQALNNYKVIGVTLSRSVFLKLHIMAVYFCISQILRSNQDYSFLIIPLV